MLETITNKISDEMQSWIKRQTNFIGHIAKLFSAFILALILTQPKIMIAMIYSILSWNHFFISFLLEFTFAIYYISPIIKREMQRQKKDELLFFGVSLEKITDYLMTVGTFKREDIEREFLISRVSYHDMVKIMDKVGVFIRGENNSRRVDIRLTKTDIIKRLSLPSPDDEVLGDSVHLEEDDAEAIQSGFVRSAIY